jgi:hypothetical protein
MVESIARVKGLLHSIKLVALSLSRKLRLRESIELLAEMVVAPDTSGPTIHAHGFLIRRSLALLLRGSPSGYFLVACISVGRLSQAIGVSRLLASKGVDVTDISTE